MMKYNFMDQRQYFAFNIWDYDSIQAVMDASSEYQKDVILQTSSRVFENLEKKTIRDFISYYSKKVSVKAHLHLDHCRKIDLIKAAVDEGWDSVMFDGSHLPLQENISLTNRAAAYAHKNGVLIEAEVGQIQGVEEEIQSTESGLADLDEVVRFLKHTDVDMIAAAIGTSHGIYKSTPTIHYELLEKICEASRVPFVVHGGSGLTDSDFLTLLSIKNVGKINISSELKQAYRKGILTAKQKQLLDEDGFDVAAVKREIYLKIKETAKSKLSLL